MIHYVGTYLDEAARMKKFILTQPWNGLGLRWTLAKQRVIYYLILVAAIGLIGIAFSITEDYPGGVTKLVMGARRDETNMRLVSSVSLVSYKT
jgi:hypothetical protein